jgi:hypothetical protein
MVVDDTTEVLYVVVEVWRGIASDAHVFRIHADADACAERLQSSANLIEDDVAVIETRVR